MEIPVRNECDKVPVPLSPNVTGGQAPCHLKSSVVNRYPSDLKSLVGIFIINNLHSCTYKFHNQYIGIKEEPAIVRYIRNNRCKAIGMDKVTFYQKRFYL